MVSITLRCSFDPPTACVTASLGFPQSVFVPPHGPAFCGSPRSSSISHDAGSTSLKCARATTGTAIDNAADARIAVARDRVVFIAKLLASNYMPLMLKARLDPPVRNEPDQRDGDVDRERDPAIDERE